MLEGLNITDQIMENINQDSAPVESPFPTNSESNQEESTLIQENQEVSNSIQQNIENEQQTSPLQSLKQSTNQNNILAKISPAKFDSLLKVLGLLTDSNDPIVINKSSIVKTLPKGAIVQINVKPIFDDEVNIHIVNPKKNIKLFKAFKNNNDIYIINDDENSRYIVMNGEIRLFLPKQDDSVTESQSEIPDLQNAQVISQFEINKETKNIISELSREADYIEYLFQDNELKALHIPETAIYIFEKYLDDPKASKLDETNAELSLQTTSFLPVSADKYTLYVGKINDVYFSYTQCDCGIVQVDIFEDLEETTGGSIF